MTDLEQDYRQLLLSPELLAQCRQATSVADFLAILKLAWQLPATSDDELLGALNKLNQQTLDIDINDLAGQWLPYAYHSKTRRIFWCLPDGHAVEPFQDQTISRYRGQLINQLLAPKTSLSNLLASPLVTPVVTPAGFIFHLSRCGSTLVSGGIMELASSNVLSESPPLTECLLDSRLTLEEKRQALSSLIHLQAQAIAPFLSGDQQVLVIKWNAWDILQWPLIHSLYPQVPVIFLIRNPVEILASHQKSAGRHMAGDLAMTEFDPSFALQLDENILAMRIRVLKNLLTGMAQWCQEAGVTVIDYRHITDKTIADILNIFSVQPNASERQAITQRMGFNAKELGQTFSPDSHQKQQLFHAAEREQIETALMPLYESLLAKTFAVGI